MKTVYVIVLMALVFISCRKDIKKETNTVINNNEISATTTAFEKQMKAGKKVYTKLCAVCHQVNGQGIPGAFPPVAKSDYLNADANRAISILLKGKTGQIIVNGVTYNSVMSPQALSSQEAADVLTYIYNSWENNKTIVTKANVDAVKGQ